MSERDIDRIDHNEWAVVATVVLAGTGIAVGSQLLVAAATLPLWYVVVAVFGVPQTAMVEVDRQCAVGDSQGTETSDPTALVTVRTTVQNVGPDPISDLRIVDGVPEALAVVSGSPRRAVTLDPLETATFEYELDLQRGEHRFSDATIRTRDLTGTVTTTWTESVTGDQSVHCSPAVSTVPVEGGATGYAGSVATDEGGSGIEFYAVREYEPGDPANAIDWRRYAGTRELATVEHRAERATRIICVVDARRSQYRAATTDRLSAVELSAAAAEHTFETLVASGHATGIISLQEKQVSSVLPGTDATTRRRASALLEQTREQDSCDGEIQTVRQTQTGDPVVTLSQTLPGEAQVYLFSSFVDDAAVDIVEGLRTRGYSVRVVAPNVTEGVDTLGTRLEALDRETRLTRARSTGAHVVDWDLERPLGLVVGNAIGGHR